MAVYLWVGGTITRSHNHVAKDDITLCGQSELSGHFGYISGEIALTSWEGHFGENLFTVDVIKTNKVFQVSSVCFLIIDVVNLVLIN